MKWRSEESTNPPRLEKGHPTLWVIALTANMSVSRTANFEVRRSFVTGGSLGNTVLDYNPCVTPEGYDGHRWIYPFAQSGSCGRVNADSRPDMDLRRKDCRRPVVDSTSGKEVGP